MYSSWPSRVPFAFTSNCISSVGRPFHNAWRESRATRMQSWVHPRLMNHSDAFIANNEWYCNPQKRRDSPLGPRISSARANQSQRHASRHRHHGHLPIAPATQCCQAMNGSQAPSRFRRCRWKRNNTDSPSPLAVCCSTLPRVVIELTTRTLRIPRYAPRNSGS